MTVRPCPSPSDLSDRVQCKILPRTKSEKSHSHRAKYLGAGLPMPTSPHTWWCTKYLLRKVATDIIQR